MTYTKKQMKEIKEAIKLAYDKGFKEGKIIGYRDRELYLKELEICARYL